MDLGKKSAEDAPDTAAQDMGYWSGMLFQVIVDKRNLLPVTNPQMFLLLL